MSCQSPRQNRDSQGQMRSSSRTQAEQAWTTEAANSSLRESTGDVRGVSAQHILGRHRRMMTRADRLSGHQSAKDGQQPQPPTPTTNNHPHPTATGSINKCAGSGTYCIAISCDDFAFVSLRGPHSMCRRRKSSGQNAPIKAQRRPCASTNHS